MQEPACVTSDKLEAPEPHTWRLALVVRVEALRAEWAFESVTARAALAALETRERSRSSSDARPDLQSRGKIGG